MDSPGTVQEKYEAMKAQKVRKGHWNADAEKELRRALGMPETEAPVVELAKPAKKSSAKPKVSTRAKVGKKVEAKVEEPKDVEPTESALAEEVKA